jgi:prepilin-type N-terminal cleavage/methylation domain-containing protein
MKLKKAFTLIELIFVIVIIGILSAILVPRFDRPTLVEAAHQVVSHIRYTQHLAMVDNKFDSNEPEWYKGRWQIFFAKTNGSDKEWAYTIFSDIRGTKGLTGFPDTQEIARNPINPQNQYLTGGYTWGNIPYKDKVTKVIDPRVTKSMNLGHYYGIKDVQFKGGCRNRKVRRIAYDNIGRPLYGNSKYLNSLYTGTSSPNGSHLLSTQCIIQLCIVNDCSKANDNEVINIAIEPETGYTYLL